MNLRSLEADELLYQHYPEGWERDFYLIDPLRKRCYKGLGALIRASKPTGLLHAIAKYMSYKVKKMEAVSRLSREPTSLARRGHHKEVAILTSSINDGAAPFQLGHRRRVGTLKGTL